VRIGRAIRDNLTLLDRFTLEHVHLTMLGNQNLIWVRILRRDHQALLTLGFLAEGHHTTDFGQDGRLFRATGLEKVGDPRQTTGNVPGLRAFLRNTGNHVTQLDLGAIGHGHQRVGWQEEDRGTTTWQLDIVTLVVDQLYRRTDVLTSGRTLFGVDNLHRGQTCQFVGLGTDSNALIHVDELGSTFRFGDDRVRVWVPLGNCNPSFHGVTVLDGQHRAIGQLVPLTLTTLLIGNGQR